MKKILTLMVALATLAAFSQTPAHAQLYNTSIYNNYASLNRAVAMANAKAYARGSKSKARSKVRKHRKTKKHYSNSQRRTRRSRGR